MDKLALFGERQQQLLTALLENRGGMTVESISTNLDISRNAVNQHLSSLESAGLVKTGALTKQRGRPSRLYQLTAEGLEIFPRHYSLISVEIIRWMIDNLGEKQLIECLQTIGKSLADNYKDLYIESGKDDERMQEVVQVMKNLGYAARLEKKNKPEIIATNCVFHELADSCNQVCELDLSLLSNLLGKEIEHKECMVRGGHCCRFVPGKTIE